MSIWYSILFLFLCSASSFAQQHTILIIADDVSADYFACYNLSNDTATAPNIQNLANNGVKFTKVWATPVCSPTRAGIMTGRYPFRTGVGDVITGPASPQISLTEVGLGNLLRDAGPISYNTACIGKWHLNNDAPAKHSYPFNLGFNFYSGNFNGAISDYYSYTRVTNGVVDTVNTYATTQTVNDAIGWLDTINTTKPFFLWLSFNAPHDPFHLPPANLCNTAGLPGSTPHINANKSLYFKAAIEAMDTEMGRLFDYLSVNNMLDSTNIIFIGDNGNSNQVSQIPMTPNHAKGTIYDYGVHVPMIVSGPAVVHPNRTSDALLNTPDLYATIAELSGFTNWQSAIPLGTTVDSRSFKALILDLPFVERTWIFTEIFKSTPTAFDGKTIRNADYHLIRFDTGVEEFYNVTLDYAESSDLLLNPSAMSNVDWDNYVFLCDSISVLTGTTGCSFLSLDENKTEEISVYPNPFANFILVKGLSAQKEIRLKNVLGQDCTSYLDISVQMDHATLQTSRLAKGSYYLEIGEYVIKISKTE